MTPSRLTHPHAEPKCTAPSPVQDGLWEWGHSIVTGIHAISQKGQWALRDYIRGTHPAQGPGELDGEPDSVYEAGERSPRLGAAGLCPWASDAHALDPGLLLCKMMDCLVHWAPMCSHFSGPSSHIWDSLCFPCPRGLGEERRCLLWTNPSCLGSRQGALQALNPASIGCDKVTPQQGQACSIPLPQGTCNLLRAVQHVQLEIDTTHRPGNRRPEVTVRCCLRLGYQKYQLSRKG